MCALWWIIKFVSNLNQIADTRIVPSSKRLHLTFCWTSSTRLSLLLSHFIFFSFKEYQSRICWKWFNCSFCLNWIKLRLICVGICFVNIKDYFIYSACLMQSSGQFCFWFLLFILNYCWLLAVYQLVTSVSLCRDQPSSLSAGSFPQFTTRNPSYIIHLTPEALISTLSWKLLSFSGNLEYGQLCSRYFWLLEAVPDL